MSFTVKITPDESKKIKRMEVEDIEYAYKDRDVLKKNLMEKDEIEFVCGNPNVEEVYGVIRLFKSRKLVETDSEKLPKERSLTLCVVAVPSYFLTTHFLSFLESHLDNIKKIRIIRDGSPNKYLVILRFDSQDHVDSFYQTFNGKRFTSIDPEVCHLIFTKEVIISGQDTTSPMSSHFIVKQLFDMKVELPSCPVCLERLDEEVSGVITTLCNHEFHAGCLKRWGDSRCPVCRYSLEQEELDAPCEKCGSGENLWICMTCGHIGCGRYVKGHARDHFRDTGHCYSMEVESKRVWDYVGDGYVHRLIMNEEDGKPVEVLGKGEESESSDEEDGSHSKKKSEKLMKRTLKIKQSEMEAEYNKLLMLNLTQQRVFFEGRERELKREGESKFSQIQNKLEMLEKQNRKLHSLVVNYKSVAKKHQETTEDIKKENEFLKEVNKGLESNQLYFKKKQGELEDVVKKSELKSKDLEEQIKELYMHIEMAEKIKKNQDGMGSMQDGSLGVKSKKSTSSNNSRNRNQQQQKNKKKKKKKKKRKGY